MKKSRFIFILLFSIFLAGCGSASPTLSPEEQQAQLATMVAATVEAAQTADTDPAPVVEEAPTKTVSAQPVQTYANFAGLRVAYIKEGNLHVWTEGGSATLLINTGDVRSLAISDDGQYIAYVRELVDRPVAFELWFINTEGTNIPTLLVSADELAALKESSSFSNAEGLRFDQLVWRPGTHVLAYNTAPVFMGPGYAPAHDLRTINIDTMEKQTVFDFEEGGLFTFSPDGSQVALSTPESVSIANADGSNLRADLLTYPVISTYSEYSYHPSPFWMADSMSLRVGIPPQDSLADPAALTTLWYLPVDGSAPTQLSSINPMPLYWPDGIFSPDASVIAYVKRLGEPINNQTELHIAYADGSNDYVFASGGIINLISWTPDSTRFVYAESGESQGLYLGELSGASTLIASLPQSVSQMTWVDNDRFLYIQQDQSVTSWELRISHMGGTNHAFIDTVDGSYARFDKTP